MIRNRNSRLQPRKYNETVGQDNEDQIIGPYFNYISPGNGQHHAGLQHEHCGKKRKVQTFMVTYFPTP